MFPAFGGLAKGDLCSLAGVVLIAAGLWMIGNQHRHRWDIEEAIKDEKLTEHQARRRIAWVKWRAVGLVIAGLVMVLVAITMPGR